jgi:hypothetical protein
MAMVTRARGAQSVNDDRDRLGVPSPRKRGARARPRTRARDSAPGSPRLPDRPPWFSVQASPPVIARTPPQAMPPPPPLFHSQLICHRQYVDRLWPVKEDPIAAQIVVRAEPAVFPAKLGKAIRAAHSSPLWATSSGSASPAPGLVDAQLADRWGRGRTPATPV